MTDAIRAPPGSLVSKTPRNFSRFSYVWGAEGGVAGGGVSGDGSAGTLSSIRKAPERATARGGARGPAEMPRVGAGGEKAHALANAQTMSSGA